MKSVSNEALMASWLQTQGALSHLSTRPEIARRRHKYDFDFQSLGDPFIRDLSVILASKAWRRAGGKNQVASSPFVPLVRNRATHIAEVMQISIRLADWLGLNDRLAQAIAANHDLGHVPLGHQGEHYLQKRYHASFSHEIMGVVVMQHIERRGHGVNLTWQTLDGGYRHSGKNATESMTPEAWLVRYADKLAYIYADYNDFKRLEWRCDPKVDELMSWFGFSQRDRTFRTMVALCKESSEKGRVCFEFSEAAQNFTKLRGLMYLEYERIVQQDVHTILDPVWDFLDRSRLIPPWLGISLLTDDEVCRLSSHKGMMNSREIMHTGLGEIIKTTDRDVLFAIHGYHLDLDW
jgi:dGTP triphosphohydrolase